MVVCSALKRDQRNGWHGDPSISRFPACRNPILVGICHPGIRDFANSPSKGYTSIIPIPTIRRKQSVVLRPDLHPSHKVGCGKRTGTVFISRPAFVTFAVASGRISTDMSASGYQFLGLFLT